MMETEEEQGSMRRTNKQGIVEIKGRESFESECLTGIKCSREYPLGKR